MDDAQVTLEKISKQYVPTIMKCSSKKIVYEVKKFIAEYTVDGQIDAAQLNTYIDYLDKRTCEEIDNDQYKEWKVNL